MKRKVLLLLYILLFVGIDIFGQNITIPYDVTGGKMRVKVSVNGTDKLFIFDTGGQTTITAALQKELDIKVTDSVRITDATSVQKYYPKAMLRSLLFADSKELFNSVPTLLLEADNTSFDCFKCDGLIGNDFIRNFILEIDSRTQQIKLYPKGATIKANLRSMIKLDGVNDDMPVITLIVDEGKPLQVLFDTGYSSFLSLKNSDYQQLESSRSARVIAEGTGGKVVGISGIESASHNLKKVGITSLAVGMGKFENIYSVPAQVPYSLLGKELLDHGKVIIDYGRRRFYFEPFDKKPVDKTKKNWNVGMAVRGDKLFISSVWGALTDKVNIGDEVLSIDGNVVENIDFCTSITSGIPALKGKNSCVLSIIHNGEKRNLTISKE